MRTYFIAEIGINHEGSKSKCFELISQAKRAGADAVKLQTVDPDESYMEGTESYEVFSKGRLTKEETIECLQFAEKMGIDFFTTAGDLKTFDWVDRLNVKYHKISSGLFTHTPLIMRAIQSSKPLILSTGMANDDEMDEVINLLRLHNKKFTLLHCVSKYPTPLEMANLCRMNYLKEKYNVEIGYSDHCLGIQAVQIAVAAGAKMIEKHFTFSKNRAGYDHHISIEEHEFLEMVTKCREIETALGQVEDFAQVVNANRSKYLRCIVAGKKILKGDKFSSENVSIKRPIQGIQGMKPKDYLSLIGKTAKLSYEYNQPISDTELK